MQLNCPACLALDVSHPTLCPCLPQTTFTCRPSPPATLNPSGGKSLPAPASASRRTRSPHRVPPPANQARRCLNMAPAGSALVSHQPAPAAGLPLSALPHLPPPKQGCGRQRARLLVRRARAAGARRDQHPAGGVPLDTEPLPLLVRTWGQRRHAGMYAWQLCWHAAVGQGMALACPWTPEPPPPPLFSCPHRDRRGGRDHIWLVSHDEASCYVPAAIRSSIILSHWGWVSCQLAAGRVGAVPCYVCHLPGEVGLWCHAADMSACLCPVQAHGRAQPHHHHRVRQAAVGTRLHVAGC